MPTIRIFDEGTFTESSNLADVAPAVQRKDSLVWIDIEGEDVDSINFLIPILDLHELAVEDVLKHGQRAKLERYPSHAFLVSYARVDQGEMAEVDIFFGENWLVTVREENEIGLAFDEAPVLERYARLREVDPKVGFLLYTILDEVVDGYFTVIDESEDRLEDIEENLFDVGPPPDGGLQKELLELRRSTIMLRRRIVPLRDVVLALLRREIPWVELEAIVYLENVLDHLLRIIDQIDTQRELASGVVDASLALGANRMNEVMKKMTSWGAILIVATIVTGIYGMNFKYMPELDSRWGYPAALLSILLAMTCLYAYFRRKKWL